MKAAQAVAAEYDAPGFAARSILASTHPFLAAEGSAFFYYSRLAEFPKKYSSAEIKGDVGTGLSSRNARFRSRQVSPLLIPSMFLLPRLTTVSSGLARRNYCAARFGRCGARQIYLVRLDGRLAGRALLVGLLGTGRKRTNLLGPFALFLFRALSFNPGRLLRTLRLSRINRGSCFEAPSTPCPLLRAGCRLLGVLRP